MKKLFPGHFQKTEQEINKIWDSCLFVFDANILLNLYRYSDDTREEFIKLLISIKDRVWLPNKVAAEYLENRLTVISSQVTLYDKSKDSILTLQKDFENSRQHPFIKPLTMEKLKVSFSSVISELEESKEHHLSRINKDEIKESIGTIFDDKVGSPYETQALEDLIEEGKIRFENKTPPGYQDKKKLNSDDSFEQKCRAYGDFILWSQLIDKSKSDSRNLIFITDDKKEDWWLIKSSRIVSPRPELIKEFNIKSGHDIQIYQSSSFIEFANKHLDNVVSKDTLSEVKDVSDSFINTLILKKKNKNKNKNKIKTLFDSQFYYDENGKYLIKSRNIPEDNYSLAVNNTNTPSIKVLKTALLVSKAVIGNLNEEMNELLEALDLTFETGQSTDEILSKLKNIKNKINLEKIHLNYLEQCTHNNNDENTHE